MYAGKKNNIKPLQFYHTKLSTKKYYQGSENSKQKY